MNTQQYLIVRKFSLSFDGKRWKKIRVLVQLFFLLLVLFFISCMLLDNGNKNGYKIMINGASILFIFFSFVWDCSWDRFLQDVCYHLVLMTEKVQLRYLVRKKKRKEEGLRNFTMHFLLYLFWNQQEAHCKIYEFSLLPISRWLDWGCLLLL